MAYHRDARDSYEAQGERDYYPHPKRPYPSRDRSNSNESYFPPRSSYCSNRPPPPVREKSKTSPVLLVGLLAAAAAAFHIWHDKREEREKEDRRRKRKAFEKAKRARRRDEERSDRRAAEEDDDLIDMEMEATRRRRISWHPEGSKSESNTRMMLEGPPSEYGNESEGELRRVEHRREQSTVRGG